MSRENVESALRAVPDGTHGRDCHVTQLAHPDYLNPVVREGTKPVVPPVASIERWCSSAFSCDIRPKYLA
jgi:hypothetical protein